MNTHKKMRERVQIAETCTDPTAHETVAVFADVLARYPCRASDDVELDRLRRFEAARAIGDELTRAAIDMMASAEPHEVFYIQLADDGEAICKWSRTPFEGARKCRVALGLTPTKLNDSGDVEQVSA